jgi:uncharacterized membrane protein
MDALSEAILRLLRRQEQTDQRLARLEAALGITPAPASAPSPAPVPPLAVTPEAEVPPMVTAVPPIASEPEPAPVFAREAAAEPSDEPRRFETRMGLTWLNRIGVITSVFAVAFFFKYAVERGWIGETVRVALGTCAGLLALLLGDWLWRRGQRVYAQGIVATGIGILYLSFYAAYALYHLFPPQVAFVLMALTTGAAGTLSVRYNTAAIAALALLGGYATPVLLSTGENRPWFLLTYLFILAAGAVLLGDVRKWYGIQALAFAGTVFLYATQLHQRENRSVATVFGFIYYALFAAVDLPAVFILAQILLPMAIAGLWHAGTGPYIAFTLALTLSGLAISDGRGWRLGALATFAGFWFSYAEWYGWERQQRPVGTIVLFLTAGAILFFAWAPWRVLIRRAQLQASELLLVALNGGVYFAVCYSLLNPNRWLGLFAVAIAVAHMALGVALFRTGGTAVAMNRPAVLEMAIAWVFLTLAVPIQFSGYRITMLWALEAAALTWISVRAAETRLALAAYAMFGLVLLRLLAVDRLMYGYASDFTLLVNARFLTFAIVAISLWATAWWTRLRTDAAILYVGGHCVMLWALSIETFAWAARNAPPDYFGSFASTALSMLFAAYAVLMVAVGVFNRTVLDRIFGLALIAFVVVKLYLYDVWLLELVYRMAAFAGLGALLLLMSYLYSRHRVTIESWWRKGPARS